MHDKKQYKDFKTQSQMSHRLSQKSSHVEQEHITLSPTIFNFSKEIETHHRQKMIDVAAPVSKTPDLVPTAIQENIVSQHDNQSSISKTQELEENNEKGEALNIKTFDINLGELSLNMSNARNNPFNIQV